MALSLIPNRQTLVGGAHKHHKTLTDRTWGDQGSYRKTPTATRARAAKGPGGTAATLTHAHTQGEALEGDNSCGRPIRCTSTDNSLVRSRSLKNGGGGCGGSASPELIRPTPTTRAPTPGVVIVRPSKRLGPLRPVQGTGSAQYSNSYRHRTHRKK
jgi:hypothetical protein